MDPMQVTEAAIPAGPDSPVAILAAAVGEAPEQEALVADGLRLTYAGFGAIVAGLAAELRADGAAGHVVLVALRNGVEMAAALYAVQAAGAVLCPVNPDYTPRELAAILADATPHTILTKAETADRLRAALPPGSGTRLRVLGDDPAANAARWLDQGAVLDAGGIDPDAVAALQYTGGTTGLPKGVELTHRAIATNVAQREAVLPTLPGDRVLCVMPLFHVFASSTCLHLAAWCRGTLVILPRYRPDWVLDTIAAERITLMPAGPTIFTGLMSFAGFARADFSSLRACYSGSAPLPVDTLTRWNTATGCPIYEGFGQTEAGPILTYNSPHYPVRPGSVGRAVPGTRLRIVDTETGLHDQPPGTPGEVVAQGPQIMRGYRGNPAATAHSLRNGWLFTGDIGVLDADGYLTICDRKKDMVITGGFNVYPREVDEVLAAHPLVEEAATIGMPDPYRGEVLKSFVRPVPGAELDAAALTAWAAERLVKYKVPGAIELVAELPRTAVNKIDKKALRERATAALLASPAQTGAAP
ncbi:MAG: hypothetical protein RLY86_2048 [Pseudomonadota bacterium]|jgi:long-chain acyl-CoA synthetase